MMNFGDGKKSALVTGGNAGIGFETCRGLLEAGFHVILCAQYTNRRRTSHRPIARAFTIWRTLSLDYGFGGMSVRRAANVALGISGTCKGMRDHGVTGKRTVDGFEQQWQVNVLGHFLFCRIVLPMMTEQGGRIVHVSSGAHRRHPTPIDYQRLRVEHQSDEAYDRWFAYGRSKLANILFSNELARRLLAAGSTLTSNALHPNSAPITTPMGRSGRVSPSPKAQRST